MKVRLESMSKIHCILFIVVFIAAIAIIFGASFESQYMLDYQTGDSYACINDKWKNETTEVKSNECLSLLHHDGYIWLQRVDNLDVQNQILLVYGYIQQSPYDNLTGNTKLVECNILYLAYQEKSFTVKYKVYIRGKNQDSEEWDSITSETDESNSINCKKDSNICGIILVAHIPLLQYQTYDVYIEITNKDEIDKNLLQNTHFKMAYINDDFTRMQLIVRVVFMAISLIVCILYLCKILRVPRGVKKTYDQQQLIFISIACVLFNDPTYAINIYKPTFYTYIISQLWLAVFFVYLLQYWLRSVERIKDEPTEQQMLNQNSLRLQRGVHGIRKRSPLEIIKSVFFLLFILDILVLYVIYLYNVKDKPTFSNLQQIPSVLIAFIVLTAIFLVVYAIWYIVTLIMTFVYFCQLSFKSRIMFIYSLVMLFICLITVGFGVYSPFYYNGQIFMFFLAIFNFYVWSLIYLNWPVEYSDMIRLGEEIEMEIKFSRNDNNESGVQRGYDMRNHNANGHLGGHHLGHHRGMKKVDTEEEKQTDNSQIIATGTRDIKIEF